MPVASHMRLPPSALLVDCPNIRCKTAAGATALLPQAPSGTSTLLCRCGLAIFSLKREGDDEMHKVHSTSGELGLSSPLSQSYLPDAAPRPTNPPAQHPTTLAKDVYRLQAHPIQ